MRPLFVDYPADPRAWDIDDEFLLGPDMLVAPVTQAGQRSRQVYLPAGPRWVDTATGDVVPGGGMREIAAPLERIPVLMREGADVPIVPPQQGLT